MDASTPRASNELSEEARAETFLVQIGYDRIALTELLAIEEENMLSLLALPRAVGSRPTRTPSLPPAWT